MRCRCKRRTWRRSSPNSTVCRRAAKFLRKAIIMITTKKNPAVNGAAKSEAPASPLSALEISGAICARVVHDLSNLTSGIIGNAEYAQGAGPHPENLQRALDAISHSANTAGKVLGQCLPLQRLVSGEAAVIDADDMARRISETATLAPGWHGGATARLTGQVRV